MRDTVIDISVSKRQSMNSQNENTELPQRNPMEGPRRQTRPGLITSDRLGAPPSAAIENDAETTKGEK